MYHGSEVNNFYFKKFLQLRGQTIFLITTPFNLADDTHTASLGCQWSKIKKRNWGVNFISHCRTGGNIVEARNQIILLWMTSLFYISCTLSLLTNIGYQPGCTDESYVAKYHGNKLRPEYLCFSAVNVFMRGGLARLPRSAGQYRWSGRFSSNMPFRQCPFSWKSWKDAQRWIIQRINTIPRLSALGARGLSCTRVQFERTIRALVKYYSRVI